MAAGIYVLIAKVYGFAVLGWSSTLLSIYFLGSIQLVFMGILGEYVYRNYKESQNRPTYFVRKFYDGCSGKKMNETRLKYIFYCLSALLLVLMLSLSKNAGISCDEVLHYDHSVAVYNYFASHGKDQAALNTPVTNLKYYGQSYDNYCHYPYKVV